jgi:hypothetical protein
LNAFNIAHEPAAAVPYISDVAFKVESSNENHVPLRSELLPFTRAGRSDAISATSAVAGDGRRDGGGLALAPR